MTKLQLALDGQLSEGLALLAHVHDYLDIIEAGTPLILREGVAALHALRQAYPKLTLLADFKIMDAGYEEATIAFAAGARIVTVLGVANDETIAGAVRAAKEYHSHVMVDMMRVSEPLERTRSLLAMDCDLICFHTAYDLQGKATNLPELIASIRSVIPAFPLAIAGGIKAETVPDLLKLHPDILVVGGAIARSENPLASARTIKEMLR